jgi:hypothetical protein
MTSWQELDIPAWTRSVVKVRDKSLEATGVQVVLKFIESGNAEKHRGRGSRLGRERCWGSSSSCRDSRSQDWGEG